MKELTRKVLTVLLAVLLLCSLAAPAFAVEEEESTTSGSCGEGVTWDFDEDTGILTLSGKGAIESIPWSEQIEAVKKVVIEEGATGICDSAFRGCTVMTELCHGDGSG